MGGSGPGLTPVPRRAMRQVSRVCEWHERQYRNSLRPSQHHQQREDISEETMQAGEMELVDEFKVEARLSRKQLTEERRAKIQALYRAEAEMYYDELAMKGLALLPVV